LHGRATGFRTTRPQLPSLPALSMRGQDGTLRDSAALQGGTPPSQPRTLPFCLAHPHPHLPRPQPSYPSRAIGRFPTLPYPPPCNTIALFRNANGHCVCWHTRALFCLTGVCRSTSIQADAFTSTHASLICLAHPYYSPVRAAAAARGGRRCHDLPPY